MECRETLNSTGDMEVRLDDGLEMAVGMLN